MKRSSVFASLAVVALGAGAAAVVVRTGVLRDVPPGVRVDGRVVPSEVGLGSAIEARRVALLKREVALGTPAGFHALTLGELGVEVDVAATMRAVEARLGGSLQDRVNHALLARDGGIDVPLSWRFDPEKARTQLNAIALEVRREPISARLDLMAHTRIDAVPGAELDVDKTIQALSDLRHEQGDVVVVADKSVRPAVTDEDVAKVDVAKVLSSQETNFVLWGVGAGRAVNIANAAKHLDGFILGPGETFSFNAVVGPRSLENGFTFAPEIVGDELEIGVGGGTCQLASTLHGASLFGAMDVLERHSHGRPSAYTRMGMDATVAYGKVDLKLRNPYAFPIIIHAYLPKPTTVRVEILGADPVAKVDYRFGIAKSDDFFRRITLKPGFPAGKVTLHQKGNRGFSVVSTVTTTWPDGHADERNYTSEYRPVPEVFWVGPGFDETALPEMPDGAARVERRGLPKVSSADEQGGASG